jgi:hypothetical protein
MPYEGIYGTNGPNSLMTCCLFLNCNAIKGHTSFNSVSSSVDFDEVFSKSPDFNDMFQQGAKNIEGSFFRIFVSYMVYGQGWLNFFLHDHHFG